VNGHGRPHVALIGLMGAGKTTIGRRLARELGLPFTDTDELVVAAAERPIVDIFAEEGEPGFRAREYVAACDAFARPAGVVSLGGGAVSHAPTRDLIARSAVRVYIAMSPHAIVARLHRAQSVRPLLGAAPTVDRIEELLARRASFYREAELTVQGDRGSTGAIARAIVAGLAAYRSAQPDAVAR